MALDPGASTKKRALGRSLGDFPDLSDAEREVIAAAREGRTAEIGPGIPATSETKCRVRAGVVRFLALGGDDAAPVHEKGVSIQGARIEGDLDLEGCTLVGDLVLEKCDLGGALLLRGSHTRTIALRGSHCGDIAADAVKVAGTLFLREGFVAKGAVRLIGATVDGDLDCSGGCFEGAAQHEVVLLLDQAKIGGAVRLSNGFAARGVVRLSGVAIDGEFDCTGGRFDGKDEKGRGLLCDGARIGDTAFLGNGFVATGTVRLVGVTIAANLGCEGGRFEGRDENDAALDCDRIAVGGCVYLCDGFVALTIVRLLGARIGLDVYCHSGTFGAEPDASKQGSQGSASAGRRRASPYSGIRQFSPTLDLSYATVAGTLAISGPPETTRFHGVALTGAKIGRIADAVRGSSADTLCSDGRAEPSFLVLDGLTYQRFGEPTDLSAPARIAFLRLQKKGDLGENFKPQPWEQMIKVLREMGHDQEARTVAIEKQKALRQTGNMTRAAGYLHDLYGLFYGYGYRPLRVGLWALLLAGLSALVFWVAADNGVMMPTDQKILDDKRYASCRQQRSPNWTRCDELQYAYTVFNPVLYSFELILPIVGSRQTKDWAPQIVIPCGRVGIGNTCGSTADAANAPPSQTQPGYSPLGIVTAFVAGLDHLFGWVAGLVFVAVVSGLIKKD